MPTIAKCANSTVIQPTLTYPITKQQQKFRLQPQMIKFSTNTTHFIIPDLHTLFFKKHERRKLLAALNQSISQFI